MGGVNGVHVFQPNFTFVPSISALNIKAPYNNDVFYDIAANDIISTNKTLFKDYDAQVPNFVSSNPNNNPHATLIWNPNANPVQNNARLILLETMGFPTPLLRPAANTTLSGYFNFGQINSAICTSSKLRDVTVSGSSAILGIMLMADWVLPLILPQRLTLGRFIILRLYSGSRRLREFRELKLFLINNGFSREHIFIKGFGSKKTAFANQSREGRAMNRRVEITLQPN